MALMLFHHWNQLSSASVGWCHSQNMEEEALRAESRVPSHLDERHEQRVVLVYTLAVGLKTKPTSPAAMLWSGPGSIFKRPTFKFDIFPFPT